MTTTGSGRSAFRRAWARGFVVREERIGRVLAILLGIAFVAMIVSGIAAARAMGEQQHHAERVAHTLQVEIAIAEFRRLIEQGETARRGALLTAGDQRILATFDGARAASDRALARIAQLTADNPRQRAAMAALRPQLARLARASDESIALVRQGAADGAVAQFRERQADTPLPTIRAVLDQMSLEERRLLALRDAAQKRSVERMQAMRGLAFLALLLIGAALLFVATRSARAIAGSRDAVRELNDTLEEQVAERTADLTRANEEIQRFAYIVSHDLRSPLVNVMGFTAELEAAGKELRALVDRVEADAPALLTDDARLAAREDLPEAVGFIRTSTQKMDRLINAILKLSREGRRVIAPEPLDPAEIAENAVAALRHIIDERGIDVGVRRPMPRLVSDRLAVEQILSNLLENATKYLQPGRPGRIIVSGAEERGRVIIAVADNGRGIAPADHQRIFDLFRRSGTQDQPGEGIGLAHVRALAYRLGGTIDVQSTLGEGSTFRLILPAAFGPATSMTTMFQPGARS
jgi:signal transduction histidine kinase